jgi:hypothetical protein
MFHKLLSIFLLISFIINLPTFLNIFHFYYLYNPNLKKRTWQ